MCCEISKEISLWTVFLNLIQRSQNLHGFQTPRVHQDFFPMLDTVWTKFPKGKLDISIG